MKNRICIIGGGPGGYTAALRAAGLGAQVTLIEKAHLGGTCLNYGCIPSKIMKHSADCLLNCLKAGSMGLQIAGSIAPDMTAIMQRKEKIVGTQRKGIAGLLQKAGVQTLSGRAKIAGKTIIDVVTKDGESLTIDYDKLIIATGTVPLDIPNFPFDHEQILSSNDILSLETIPGALTIVGGGVIGCEFACIFNALGSQVTIVEAMDRILPLPSVDANCSRLLLREMKKRKIKVLCNTVVTRAEKSESGLDITLDVSPFCSNENKQPKIHSISSQIMAVCIGRRPAAEDLGIENIGLAADKGGWIPVNEYMETGVDNVYAIGDILGPDHVMLAHVASHEGLVAGSNAAGQPGEPRVAMSYDAVPGAIFTMPEVGTVGLTEDQAKDIGIMVETATVNFRVLGKAHAIDEIAGETKMIIEKVSGKILGVHMVGPHATDLIAEAVLAVKKGLTARDLAETIHAHPTLAEIMGETALKVSGTPLHG